VWRLLSRRGDPGSFGLLCSPSLCRAGALATDCAIELAHL